MAHDARGRLVGHISDPVEGWRRPFASLDELWRLLSGSPPGEQENPLAGKPLPPDHTP